MEVSLKGRDLLDLELFKDINIKLNRISSLINIALIGADGIGKSSRMYLLLYKLYGDNIYKAKLNKTVVKYKTVKTEIEYYMSNYHLDIDISKYKYTFCIIKQFLIPYMKSFNMITFQKKVLILRNVHMFSNDILKILINIIEKYTETTTFILIGSNIKYERLKSHFCIIHFPSLSYDDVTNFIKNTSIKINNVELTTDNINNLIKKSSLFKDTYNLKNITKLIEMSTITGEYINFSNSISKIVDDILDIVEKKNIRFNKIIKIKEILYKIFSYNYPIIDIIKYIQRKIIKKYGDNTEFIYDIVKISNDISKKIILTNKKIIYLEFFIISYLNLLNNYNLK